MSVAHPFPSPDRLSAAPKAATVRQHIKRLAKTFRFTSQTPGELFAILGHIGLAAYAIAMLIHLARTS